MKDLVLLFYLGLQFCLVVQFFLSYPSILYFLAFHDLLLNLRCQFLPAFQWGLFLLSLTNLGHTLLEGQGFPAALAVLEDQLLQGFQEEDADETVLQGPGPIVGELAGRS